MYDENHARQWYEANGVTDEDWEKLDETTKKIISIEAICDSWPEVDHMRETGVPSSAVLLFIDPGGAGLDTDEVAHLSNEASYEGLTSYVMQNSTRNIARLFTNSSVKVLGVAYKNGFIRIEVKST